MSTYDKISAAMRTAAASGDPEEVRRVYIIETSGAATLNPRESHMLAQQCQGILTCVSTGEVR